MNIPRETVHASYETNMIYAKDILNRLHKRWSRFTAANVRRRLEEKKKTRHEYTQARSDMKELLVAKSNVTGSWERIPVLRNANPMPSRGDSASISAPKGVRSRPAMRGDPSGYGAAPHQAKQAGVYQPALLTRADNRNVPIIFLYR